MAAALSDVILHDLNTEAMAPKLRRLTKARRQEIKRLGIHLRAKHHLHRLGPSTPFTVYSFIIDDEARRRAPRQPLHRRKKEWVFEKRYSEFVELRTKLLSLIQLWRNTHDAVEKKSNAFIYLLDALRRPLQHAFPRKHFRCDSEAIVRERCVGLYEFVRCLFAVYANIYVYLYEKKEKKQTTVTGVVDTESRLLEGGGRDSSLGYKILWGIYLDIASFLNVPEYWKEAEYRHAAAVLTLEDCKVAGSPCKKTALSSSSSGDYACCICFDDGECDGADTCEEDAMSCSSDSSPHSELAKELQFVQLPCGHQFHEDCVILWFCASITCPLCRQPAAN